MARVLKGAVLSFYSGPFYGEVARESKGIGAAYMLLLAFVLSSLFFLLFWASGLYAQASDAIAALPEKVGTLPAITVKDGVLSIDRPSPYSVMFGAPPAEKRLVIDTNYQFTTAQALVKYMEAGHIAILVTSDHVFRYVHYDRRQPGIASDLEESDIKDSQPVTITHDDWRVMAATVSGWGMTSLTVIAFFSMVAGLFLYNFVASLLTAVALMVVDLGVKANIDFPAALRLSSVLRIPVLLWSIFPVFLGFLPLMGLSGMVLWALYVIFAVWSVKLSAAAKSA